MRRDKPSTTARKVALYLIQEDLGDRRLADVLAGIESWDGTARSVVIAEGLTQYLTPAAVRDLFVQCGAVAAAGSRIVFTYVGTGDDDRPAVGRWTGLTLWRREPLVFSKLFGSRAGEVRFGLHAREVGPELLEMAEEFAELKAEAGMETPNLDALLACVPR